MQVSKAKSPASGCCRAGEVVFSVFGAHNTERHLFLLVLLNCHEMHLHGSFLSELFLPVTLIRLGHHQQSLIQRFLLQRRTLTKPG